MFCYIIMCYNMPVQAHNLQEHRETVWPSDWLKDLSEIWTIFLTMNANCLSQYLTLNCLTGVFDNYYTTLYYTHTHTHTDRYIYLLVHALLCIQQCDLTTIFFQIIMSSFCFAITVWIDYIFWTYNFDCLKIMEHYHMHCFSKYCSKC